MKLKFRGQHEMFANTKRYSKEFPERLGRAMKAELDIEVKEMQARTPVDTGDLRDSIHATEPEIQGQAVKCSVVAGTTADGVELLYSQIQHEDLELNHPNGGQARFISSVLYESAPHIGERIAERMKASE